MVHSERSATEAGRVDALIRVLRAEGIVDERVLNAMAEVPRHELIPDQLMSLAYENRPLPIGEEQTISQPYIVALMTELARIEPGDRVLEIGTGSGYQTAILGRLARRVYTIEIVESLAARARANLQRLGLAHNVHFQMGDGSSGWQEAAPFDAIVVTAAPTKIPEPLKEQLAVGGRLVIPVGGEFQELRVIERTASGFSEGISTPVKFVPMTGEQGSPR